MVWTGCTLPYLAIVQQCEFSPAMCMKCEVFYRKPHIVSKTHNVSPTGSTAGVTECQIKLRYKPVSSTGNSRDRGKYADQT